MRTFILLLTSIVIVSCNREIKTPKTGEWRAVLELDKGKEIPFLMDLSVDNIITIRNGEEAIKIDDVVYKGDSIIISHPVFEGVFRGIFTEDSIYGNFIKPSLDRVVPFKMKQGRAERFNVKSAPKVDVSGNWETIFSPKNSNDRYVAKGIFQQTGHKVIGTFRTTTGDYRFLEGAVENDTMRLSTFDGAHAFLFEAQVVDSIMTGTFYSGNHFKESFIAKRNENYELPKADSLTFLKEGYDKIEFSFPNTKDELVSLEDERFKDKVVLVQIMGTWCPNCLDETRYYKEYYNKNKGDNLAMVSLAFEYAPTKEKAMASITKFKEAIGVPYPILLAQHGTEDKKKANQKLPMLNHILSYPTTIFIDKTGTVRRIHTGFNGPATGKMYEDYVVEFESFVGMLMEE